MNRPRRKGSDLFAVPPFEDDDQRRSATVVRAVVIVQAIGVAGYGLAVHDNAPLLPIEQLGMVVYLSLLLISVVAVRLD